MKNTKVYGVCVRVEEYCGEFEGYDEYASSVLRIFTSRKKAIEYINKRTERKVVTFNTKTEEYSYYTDDERVFLSVKEYEVE